MNVSRRRAEMVVPTSIGVYRIPYATGTRVRVNADDQTHSPAKNRYDLKSQSADKRIVAAADGVRRWRQVPGVNVRRA
jgi:hypothetical protein